MIDSRTAGFKNDCGKWFLTYDSLRSWQIKNQTRILWSLHHVASVLKQCPSACVAVVGHTDVRSSNTYNNMLSYNRAQAAVDYLVTNYGIDRSRLKLMYGGRCSNGRQIKKKPSIIWTEELNLDCVKQPMLKWQNQKAKVVIAATHQATLALSSKAIRTLAINQIWLNNIK